MVRVDIWSSLALHDQIVFVTRAIIDGERDEGKACSIEKVAGDAAVVWHT